MSVEFSRKVKIDDKILNTKFEIEANSEELRALAERFALHSLKHLKVSYLISKKDSIDGAFLLDCQLDAEVVKFVVEGEEEKLVLQEDFDVTLIREEDVKPNEEILQEEDIEIIDLKNPWIDVGEIAAQYLSLCVYM